MEWFIGSPLTLATFVLVVVASFKSFQSIFSFIFSKLFKVWV